MAVFQQLWTFTHTSWPSTWSSLNVSVPEFWALIGHLRQVRLRKSGKSRSIYDAGWSSLVARRAHNPEVVGSNPTPATIRMRQSKSWRARSSPQQIPASLR
jgi:hypothetical protein